MALGIVGFVSAFVMLLELGLRQKGKDWLIDFASVALMGGFIGMGVFAYVLEPTPVTTVILLPFYNPHAYNLVLWPLLAVKVLRPLFPGWLFLPAFIFFYGLDEIFFNLIAVLRFEGNQKILLYLGFQSWWLWFVALGAASVGGYLVARPKLKPNLTWALIPLFAALWGWGAGLPTLAADGIQNATTPVILNALAWELMWQAVFWVMVWRTAAPPGSSSPSPTLPLGVS